MARKTLQIMAKPDGGSFSSGGGVTYRFLFTVFVAAFGSAFQYGYNVGVVNAPEKAIESWMDTVLISEDSSWTNEQRQYRVTILYSLMVSFICLGGLCGGLLVDFWVALFGLKNGIAANNFLVIIAAALMGLARNSSSYHILMAGRFIVGISAGLGAGLTPMYLTEISPVAWRGAIGSAFQLFLTVSILIAQILGLDFVLGNDNDWPILFWIIAAVGLFQAILLPFCANSPRYLYSKGKEDDAKEALIWFRGTEDVDTELTQIQKEVAEEKNAGVVSLRDLFVKRQFRKPLIISCMLMIGQQLSGINAIIFYSTSTLQEANLGSFAQVGTLCIGAVNVLMTIISVAIVDKTGRKPLLLFSYAAMAIDTILFFISFLIAQNHVLVASYFCIVLLILYIIFFATGLGSIPWFLISELCTQGSRSKIVSLAVAVHWVANFIVGLCFPMVQQMVGPYVFLVFVVIQLLFGFYVIIAVPETKNKTIDEITTSFEND